MVISRGKYTGGEMYQSDSRSSPHSTASVLTDPYIHSLSWPRRQLAALIASVSASFTHPSSPVSRIISVLIHTAIIPSPQTPVSGNYRESWRIWRIKDVSWSSKPRPVDWTEIILGMFSEANKLILELCSSWKFNGSIFSVQVSLYIFHFQDLGTSNVAWSRKISGLACNKTLGLPLPWFLGITWL